MLKKRVDEILGAFSHGEVLVLTTRSLGSSLKRQLKFQHPWVIKHFVEEYKSDMEAFDLLIEKQNVLRKNLKEAEADLEAIEEKIIEIESELNQWYLYWQHLTYAGTEIWYVVVPCICVPKFVEPPPFSYYGIPTIRQIVKINMNKKKDSERGDIQWTTPTGTKIVTKNQTYVYFKHIADIVLFQAFVVGDSQ